MLVLEQLGEALGKRLRRFVGHVRIQRHMEMNAFGTGYLHERLERKAIQQMFEQEGDFARL